MSIEAMHPGPTSAEVGIKIAQVAENFMDWIVNVLDPTNIPGIGIKMVEGDLSKIEFGVLNVPGLVYGRLVFATGIVTSGG